MTLGGGPLGVTPLGGGNRRPLFVPPAPPDPDDGPTYNSVIDYEWRQHSLIAGPAPTYDDVLATLTPAVGEWNFDETAPTFHANDTSGNGRDFSTVLYTNGPGLVPSIADTSLDFTGGDLAMNHASWMDTGALTINVWVLPTNVGSLHTIVCIDDQGIGAQLSWRVRIAAGQLQALYREGGSVAGVGSPGGAMVAGVTHMVTFVHVGAADPAGARLFVDGALVGTAPTAGPLAPATGRLRFARMNPPGVEAWEGRMGHANMWGVPLSDAEVALVYGGGIGASPVPFDGWAPMLARSDSLVSWAVSGYGRADSNARTTPVQVTVVLAAPLAGGAPTVGERFRLQLSDVKTAALGLYGDGQVRFTGEVTDAVQDPKARVYTITGTGRLGRAQRRTIHPKWPRELDSARATRALTAAGVEVGTVEPGIIDVLPQLADVNVGQHLDLLAESAGGQVVEQLTGEVDYHSADHRRGSVVDLILTPAEILNDLTWAQHVGDVLNELEVTYGNPAATISVSDPESIDALDPYPGSLSTMLVDASDAHSLASLVLARRRDPVWQLPALSVDLRRTVTTPQLRKLLALRAGDRMRVADLPGVGPYVGTVDVFVEGLAEIATRTTWRLSIAVSDPRLSGVGIRWKDAPAGLTWAQVDPALTWLDVGTLEDPAALD